MDFVIKTGIDIKVLIQETHVLDENDINWRETRALLKAPNPLKCQNLIVITENYSAKITPGEEKLISFLHRVVFRIRKYINYMVSKKVDSSYYILILHGNVDLHV
jgi:hypothetical protein